jgi:hypothetical protein
MGLFTNCRFIFCEKYGHGQNIILNIVTITIENAIPGINNYELHTIL